MNEHRDWLAFLEKEIEENIQVKRRLLEGNLETVLLAAQEILSCFREGGKLLICGNGGSAADAQHIAAEMVIRLKSSFDRPAIPALALTVDSSILTAGSNDYGFEQVFARQIEALGNRGDVLLAISTSGNSANIIEAVNMAHEKGLFVIGFLGEDGGKLRHLVDLPLLVPSRNTARIQEVHIFLAHTICDIVERELFSREGK